MQNKVIQTLNTKSKNQQLITKKEITIINPLLTNPNELSKHKSLEIYNQHSSKNIINNSNPTTTNNHNRNTSSGNSIKQITNLSNLKIQNKRKSCNDSSTQKLKELKKLINNQNENDKKTIMNSEKYFIKSNNKNNKIDLDKKNNKINNKDTNFNENNIIKIKHIKRNALDNILSESDSFQEIDSMEEDNIYKGNKKQNTNAKININKLKSEELNKKNEQLSKTNYKKNLTIGYENSKEIKDKKNSKANKIIYNKQKYEKEKDRKTKKIEINNNNKNNKNNNEDLYEDLIINDSEFDNSKNTQKNNMHQTVFPKLSINPFTNDSSGHEKKTKNNNNINNINSFKNIVRLKNDKEKKDIETEKDKGKEKEKEKEELILINYHIKSSTLMTNNKSSITNPNSSNLSNIIETINNNLKTNTTISINSNINNLTKDNSDIDKKYRNLLLMAKRGDKEKFLEIFAQIKSLLHDLIDINFKDENGFSALHYSCDEGNLKIVEILLKANCDPNIRNNEKETPLHLASKRGFFDISKKLIENGASLNVYNSEKNSPLHYVCMNNFVELLKFFLTKLPQADAKNIYGKMPIDLTTDKEIKIILDEYLKKYGNKYKKIKIYQTSDSKMNNLINEFPHEERECKSSKNVGVFKNNLKNAKKKTSVSPSNKSPKNINRNQNDFNSIPEYFENSIKKRLTLPKTFGLNSSNFINIDNNINNSTNNIISTLNTSNIKNHQNNTANKANVNSVFKKNELKNSNKLKEKDNSLIKSQKFKKEQKNNIKKNKKIFIQDKNNNINNYNSINISNYSVNGLKKTKTVEKFSSATANNNLNKTNLYTNVNRGYINLNDSKVNTSNVHDRLNNSHNRINISNNRKNAKRKLNSVNKMSKERKTINVSKNILPQSNSKCIENSVMNKNKLLDSTELTNGNNFNLNKTEEIINNGPNISRISRTSLKKANNNNLKNTINTNNNITKVIQTTEKIISKNKKNKKKQNQYKKEKNVDNSLINNCNNISKISCNQNKNNNMLDSINKSNIIDQTLTDNMHNKLNLNSIEEERITPSSFVCLAQLGKGSFGEVYLVQKINTQEKYAMKVLRKERIMGQNLLKYAIAERNVLSLSHHPFIVKLNFAFQTSSKLFLILEYCPNGDLAKHLLFEKRFPEAKAKFYICEVLLALENLHQRDIIFRDLKPDNVVLDEEGHCKLTDFGLSKEGVNENQYAQSFCGSIAYLAPEMLKKQGHGKAVDWYLLGVLFYEMLVGITPYFTGRKEDIFHNIEFGELRIPNFVSSEAADLLRGLLERDPNKRLGGSLKDAQEIKEHPYFKDIDWNKVYNKEIKPPTVINYMSKMIHVYHRPRLFANDDLFNNNSDKNISNMLNGWSFINNEEM